MPRQEDTVRERKTFLRKLLPYRPGLRVVWPGQKVQPNRSSVSGACSSLSSSSHLTICRRQTILGLSCRIQTLEVIPSLDGDASQVSFANTCFKSSMLDNQKSPKGLRSVALPASFGSDARQSSRTRPSGLQSPDVVVNHGFSKPQGTFLTIPSQGLGEKLFGPTSLESLMLTFKDTLADGLDPEMPALKECSDLAVCDVSLPLNQREDLPTDESLPTAPPSAILNAMIEPYFATVNPHFPIWTKQQIEEMAATLEESTSPERDAATMICCNNLILMTLTANSLRSRWGKPLQTKHRRRHLSIDSDITAGFLMNAKRAIKHVELLLSPCLVNVQALLSLVSWSQSLQTPTASLIGMKIHKVHSGTRASLLISRRGNFFSGCTMRKIHGYSSMGVLSWSFQ